MFGDTIFENPSEQYTEYLLADEQGIRVVVCVQHNTVKLYRVELTQPDGSYTHMAVYSILDAMSMFRIQQLQAIAQLEYESQESPESRRNGYGYEAQSN